jgi:ABC-2 type transport system ATP-binding protein
MAWGLDGVTVKYGRHTALRDVSFDVAPGSVLTVVGGDGAGKTTALRSLVGLVRTASGRVHRPPIERIGVVPTSSGVYQDLTVMENLEFAARSYRVPKIDAARRADELLESTQLTTARDRLGAQLSGGMRHKLALAMGFIHEPELLVLDEVTTGVDPVSRAELWRLIARAVAHGSAAIVATTYLDEAERAASLVVLHEGQVLLSGTPREALESVPGAVYELRGRPVPRNSWRRGKSWRTWGPVDRAPDGGTRIGHDLQDAVIVAALRGAERGEAA